MRKTISGFTITELVVVIVVIGIITTIGAISLTRVQTNARDTEKSNQVAVLGEYLEKYYQQNGEYPGCSAMTGAPDTITTEVLPGIDRETLQAPGSDSDNSIICEDITNDPEATGVFAYVGDGSPECSGDGSCREFTLMYREESSGQVKTLESRYRMPTIGVPANFTASANGTDQINLSWDAVSDATGYVIEHSTDSSISSNVIQENTSSTSLSVSNLSPNTTYYFRISALITGDQGPWSNIINATTDIPQAGAPSLVVNSNSAITASWSTVSGATSYTVQRSTASNFSSPTTVSGIVGTSYQSTGLNHGQRYYFRIRALVGVVESEWSGSANATTTISTPTSVAATVNSVSAITVSWGSVTNAQSYSLQYSTASDLSGATTVNSIATTSHQVTGLNNGQIYYFSVRAAGPNTNSAWSSTVSGTTTINAPSSPSFSVSITGTANSSSSAWLPGLPSSSGTWYTARSTSPSSSCPAGATLQFRYRGQYNLPNDWYGWTSWGSAGVKYMSRPNPGYGVRFQIQARCVAPSATSASSGTTSKCAWRDSSSTSCSGFSG